MAEMVEACGDATFCCASALGVNEFLAALGALENRPATPAGSGVRELYKVFSQLENRSATCKFAISGPSASRSIWLQNMVTLTF